MAHRAQALYAHVVLLMKVNYIYGSYSMSLDFFTFTRNSVAEAILQDGSTTNVAVDVPVINFRDGQFAGYFAGVADAPREADVATISNVESKIGQTAGSVQITAEFPDDYPLVVSGLQATVSGTKTIRFEYSTTEIKLFVDSVLVDSQVNTYDWTGMDEIQLGHVDGGDQPNFELRNLIVRKA
jgi:hypothetical protein